MSAVRMIETVINGRWRLLLPEHRSARPEWKIENGGWERARLSAINGEIERQLRAGIAPIVFYVGSEEAEMAALCQIWGATVIMFEPNPKVWPNALAIWDANKLEKPPAMFVGFASNVTDLSPPHPDPLAVGLTRDWPEVAHGPVIVDHGFKELYQEADAFPQIRLDDMATELEITPTIVTFDCEGSDWEVMKGAAEILRQCRPTIFASIHPEFMFHQFGQYAGDFRRWIKDFGYDETILDYQHELHTMYLPKGVV